MGRKKRLNSKKRALVPPKSRTPGAGIKEVANPADTVVKYFLGARALPRHAPPAGEGHRHDAAAVPGAESRDISKSENRRPI